MRCSLAALLLLLSVTYNVCALQFIPDTPSPFTGASKDAPKYIITVDDRVDESPADGRYITMKDATGAAYNCRLPDDGLSPAAVPKVLEDDEPVRSPHDLLDALEGMCLYRQDGLWTYEICYKQHVRQMHQSSKEEHSCGVYDDEEEEATEVESALGWGVRIDRSTVGPALPYISHNFTGGADCLLTKRPRTSEVRFTCMEEGGQNMVTSVREFPTCNYVFIVTTPFLCKHPLFRPQEDVVQAINCTRVTHSSGDGSPGSGGDGVPGEGWQDVVASRSLVSETAGRAAGEGAEGEEAEPAGWSVPGQEADWGDEQLIDALQQSFIEEVEAEGLHGHGDDPGVLVEVEVAHEGVQGELEEEEAHEADDDGQRVELEVKQPQEEGDVHEEL